MRTYARLPERPSSPSRTAAPVAERPRPADGLRHRFQALGVLPAGAAASAAARDVGSPGWESHGSLNRFRITARIRRDPDAPAPLPFGRGRAVPGVEADSPPGEAESVVPELGAETARPSGALPTSAEPAEGSSVRLPDLVLPQAEALEEADPVMGFIGYHPTIAQGGAVPSGFGVTRPYNFSLSNISVVHFGGTYFASATVENPIQFQVRATTGPGGQVDIDSASDADIRAANYANVVGDLTPDLSDLNGRPPRTHFWAKDLTIKHERFHCTDGQNHATRGALLAGAWLNTQTASSALGVYALLAQVPGRVAATRRAAMTYPGREERAYGDGAPFYLARALHISLRGATGQYP